MMAVVVQAQFISGKLVDVKEQAFAYANIVIQQTELVYAKGYLVVINLYRRNLRISKEQINGFILTQQRNESEQMIADLHHQIADGQEVQEQLEETCYLATANRNA